MNIQYSIMFVLFHAIQKLSLSNHVNLQAYSNGMKKKINVQKRSKKKVVKTQKIGTQKLEEVYPQSAMASNSDTPTNRAGGIRDNDRHTLLAALHPY